MVVFRSATGRGINSSAPGPSLSVLVLWCAAAAVLVGLASGVYVAPGPPHRCPSNERRIFPCRCVSGERGVALRCDRASLALAAAGLALVPYETTQLVRSQHDAKEVPPASVESLVLSGLRVHRLKGADLLRPLVGLQSLLIEDTPSLVAIDGDFLPQPINATLKSLRIIDTGIAEFPSKALKHLGNASFIEISGHQIKSLPADSFSGDIASAAKLERFHLTRGPLADLHASALAPLRRLKTLNLSSNAIAVLPRGCFRAQREALESLDLSNNRLSQLQPHNLADLTRLASLNLSGNAFKTLPRGAFARNALLRILDLRRNQITAIDSSLLRGLRFLRRLRLSDNALQEINRGAFESATRIGTVDLARNNLSIVPARAFAGLRFAEEINLSGNRIRTIESGAFKDLYLVHIDLSHNELTEIEAESFTNCANMTLLDMSHNHLERIRKDAMDEISYAGELLLSFNRLTDFGSLPIANMTGLRILNVSDNSLNSVPRNAFPTKGLGLPELHTIDMSRNNISSIANGVFVPLLGLRALLLSHNTLEALGGSVFGALPSLLRLSLDSNRLTSVARATFTRCASLRTLTLANNSLSAVVFAVPPALASLHLAYNEIASLGPAPPATPSAPWPPMNAMLDMDLTGNRLGSGGALESPDRAEVAFANLLTLRTLKLDGNGLKSVPHRALARLGSLSDLSLAGNDIGSLGRRAFGVLPVISTLSLANNNISQIESRAFDGLLQLLHLDLSLNKLSHLKNDIFQGLVSLQSLDLSYNQIDKLDNKTNSLLEDCLSLERLNLSHNRIAFVTRKMFPSSPYVPYKLRVVDMSYNAMPALTPELNVGTRRVQVLNVSHNTINEIRGNVIGNLTSLRELDLSYNDLSEFEPKRLPDNLTEINIAGNKLHFVPKILQSTKITRLDLRDNHLDRFYHELMPMIENGSKILYQGNPIGCTCTLRPLHRWLDSSALPDEAAEWSNLICDSPSFLRGLNASQLPEEKLVCPEPFNNLPDLSVNPDIKLRKAERTGPDTASISWYVTTREDVGEFSLVARQLEKQPKGAGRSAAGGERSYKASQSEEASERQRITYSQRSVVADSLPSDKGWELCLLARDSEGNQRPAKEGQCAVLPPTGSPSSAALSTTFLPALMLAPLLLLRP
ncbi:toll-like receptor 6 [Ischnura elegans]|uniref:toll-like receptor 6 n=1 Tax=Ischnura elegans TaxID=197161 RepID=UPI001ED867D7|nr:toll-like receptor 6 [Ischnura elegans]XP_046403435.1 toll-like receptor 6 [Ischnura elegans]